MSPSKKNIYVQLQELQFPSEKGEFYGLVKSTGEVDNEEVAKRIVAEGCECQIETIVDILNRGDRLRTEALIKGETVHTQWANGRLTCEGVFKDTTFDSEKQKIHVSVSAPQALQESLNTLHVEVLGVTSAAPAPLRATDMKTDAVNGVITPGNVLKVEGTNQKIFGSDPDVGIWFTSEADGTKVKVDQLLTNEPKTLMFMIPELPQGSFSLTLATQYAKSTQGTKIVKTGELAHTLVVE